MPNMRQAAVFIICLMQVFMSACISPLFAAGEIRRLTGIANSMDRMANEQEQEGKNYDKAKEFINGPKIQEGLTKEDVVKECGKPVATADEGLRWVYKPPTSTFFKGEKIYLFFNNDGKLIDWRQVYQD